MILDDVQLSELQTAVEQALAERGTLYDGNIRFLLAKGIRLNWFTALPVVGNPSLQLSMDLNLFNDVERLADGSVPLEIWLRNALKMLKEQTQAVVVQQALDNVTSRMSGAPKVQDRTAPDLPLGSLPRGLEQTIHRDDTLPFNFVTGAQRVGMSVAHLKVPEFKNGQIWLKGAEPVVHLGTGWLVKPDLLITNWHVVNARDENDPAASAQDFALQAGALKAFFDFDDESRQGLPVSVSRLEATDPTLDYALLRLAQPLNDRTPLKLRNNPLEVQSMEDYVAVNIIQHPGGRAKRVAIRNNLVYRANYPTVSYFTDTDGGSSGSPVCTDDWQVVALHRAWMTARNVQYQGKMTPWVNEGTQVAAILEHLQQHHSPLHAEILGI